MTPCPTEPPKNSQNRNFRSETRSSGQFQDLRMSNSESAPSKTPKSTLQSSKSATWNLRSASTCQIGSARVFCARDHVSTCQTRAGPPWHASNLGQIGGSARVTARRSSLATCTARVTATSVVLGELEGTPRFLRAATPVGIWDKIAPPDSPLA
jgi:hypothetical protein